MSDQFDHGMISIYEILTYAQTVGIIGSLVLTVYFSRKNVKTYSTDLETRVLNDLDEKLHNLIEMNVNNPERIKVMYNVSENISSDLAFSYYIVYIFSHMFHMRERKILKDNEWSGYLQYMKNTFKYGTISEYWRMGKIHEWVDPSFRAFVEATLLTESGKSSP